MRVIATAGHVDHGKSALVKALTGMQPDRWRAERERGVTIDLGFVWTDLPDGQTVAFVDVPGHERFIANTVAGLGPCPAVLFVVAANEGWSRQSHEHLAAIEALGVTDVVLAITKCDLADPGEAADAARRHLLTAGVAEPRVVHTSARTGDGIDRLRAVLAEFLAALPEPAQEGRVRLWVDRSFTVRGSGTVVTGTLTAGTVRVGDEVELRGRRLRVRALQSLDRPRQEAGAPARVALNLADVAAAEVGRGDALLTPGQWPLTDTVDVRLRWPGGAGQDVADLPAQLSVHTGTYAGLARLRQLAGDAVRVSLPEWLPMMTGDRLILRNAGARLIVGGALVLDADPPALTRRGDARRRGEALAGAGGVLHLATEVGRRGVLARSAALALGFQAAQVSAAPGVRPVGQWLIATDTWQLWVQALAGEVDAQVDRDPLQPSVSCGAARAALRLPAVDLVAPLAAAAELVLIGGRLQRPGARRDLGVAEVGLRAMEAALREDACAAPTRDELTAAGLGPRELAAAARDGRILTLPGDVVLLPDSPARVMPLLAALPQPFTLSQARQALGSTRRVLVPLLEHLDSRGWTRRVDGARRRVVR